jgi:hypothetical protein
MSKTIPPPPPVVNGEAKQLPAKQKKHAIVMPPKGTRTKTALFKIYNLYIRTQGCTLEWAWENALVTDDPDGPRAKEWIDLGHCRNISQAEGWKAARAEMWADVRKQVTAAAKIEIVEEEVKELGVLDEMKTNLQSKMVGLLPKSLDAGVRAYIALDRRISEKRGFVAERVTALDPQTPAAGPGGSTLVNPDVADALEEEEVLQFAVDVSSSRAGMNTPQRAIASTQDGDDDEHDHEPGEE